jgi:hypothetical protein
MGHGGGISSRNKQSVKSSRRITYRETAAQGVGGATRCWHQWGGGETGKRCGVARGGWLKETEASGRSGSSRWEWIVLTSL